MGNDSKKKGILVIGISAIILITMIVAVTVGVNKNGDDNGGTAATRTSVKAITEFCQPTDYQQTCVDTLSKVGANTTDSKDLVKLSFRVAIEHIKQAFSESQVLKDAANDSRTSDALGVCQELMNFSIDELNDAVAKLGDIDLQKVLQFIDDLKIWLSAARTYEETCMDGFENTTVEAGEAMKKALKSATELTSNTLAVVSQISSVINHFKIPSSRKLLSIDNDGFPTWVSAGKRTLLQKNPVPDVVVAKDGSGKFKTILDAVKTIPRNSEKPFVIYVKEGVYKEQIEIGRAFTNVVLIGDGPTKTKISGNKNFIDGTPTFKTAPFAVIGDGFVAKNIGFENTAGADKHQAVAVRVQSDKAVFLNCQFDGYQDTLYAHTKRQFYRDCTISGTIDFIFGNAASIFQNCKIIVRKPLGNQRNIVTAHGRKQRQEPTAIIMHNCNVVADPALFPSRFTNPTFLGRPWKEYSRTLYIQSQLDDLIHPDGWLPWDTTGFGQSTCYYGEFNNRGAGANMAKRVKWPGIKTITKEIAQSFTVNTFIQGNTWLTSASVPFTAGL